MVGVLTAVYNVFRACSPGLHVSQSRCRRVMVLAVYRLSLRVTLVPVSFRAASPSCSPQASLSVSVSLLGGSAVSLCAASTAQPGI